MLFHAAIAPESTGEITSITDGLGLMLSVVGFGCYNSSRTALV